METYDALRRRKEAEDLSPTAPIRGHGSEEGTSGSYGDWPAEERRQPC